MNKVHALTVAAILTVAAVFGFVAATKTVGLRSANATASSGAVAARAHRLDRVEASLRRALRAKPPALPALPSARPAAATPQVVYRRPAPIVVVKHRANSEAEHERESDD
jgi:hypothetical protein